MAYAESGTNPLLEQTINNLSALTPGVTSPLQEFCDHALENIKAYRPEITRLDDTIAGLRKALSDLGSTSNQTLLEHNEKQQLLSRRCTQLETRVASLEALCAVLPTWKEDLMNKIDSVGRDARIKHQQICMRAQVLEDQQMQHAQATRERLDGLTNLAKTMQESRQAHAERMDAFEKNVRSVDARCEEALKELQAASTGHARELLMVNHKLTEHGVQLSVDRIDLDTLKQKALQAEQDNGFNKADILLMQDKQELFQQQVVMMDKQLKANESIRSSLIDRVSVLERDTRVQALQATAADYVAFKGQVSDFITQNGEQYQGLTARLASMDARIDKGPPGLWKITEQVAAQAVELAAHKDQLSDGHVRMSQLQESLEGARKLLEDQKEMYGYLQSDSRALSDRLVSEMRRCLAYVDSRVEQLSAKYEVEALRRLIESIQRELQEAIASMGHRVKFELLHDEIPQVNTLKAYIQQTEHAMARTMDRLGWLETGLAQESRRGEAVQAEWALTKSSLDSLILDGTFDLAGIQRQLQSFKDTFEELGHMAARGQILTVTGAEELIDKALKGPAVDVIVGKKLANSKVLREELSGYVPRHELEGLRRMIASGTPLMPSPPTTSSPSTTTTTTSPGHSTAAPETQPATTDPKPSEASAPTTISDASHPIQGPPLPPPTKGLKLDESTLLAVYKRLEAIDEALAFNTALSKSLQDKVDSTARQLSASNLQLETELPSLKQQVAVMEDLVSKGGAGGLRDSQAESVLRDLVNKTLLPGVIERQAADMMRLVKYVNHQMSRVMSSGQEQVQELQAAVNALEARLGSLQGGAQAAVQQPVASSAAAASDGVALPAPTSDAPPEPAQTDASGTGMTAGAAGQDRKVSEVQASQAPGPPIASLDRAATQASEGETRPQVEMEGMQDMLNNPSVQELNTLVRAATMRLDAVEKLVGQLVQQAVTGDEPAGLADAAGGSVLGGTALSDLSLMVRELREQVPLLARGYELEGVVHSVSQLRQEMHTKLKAVNTAPVLNLTLTCPAPPPAPLPGQQLLAVSAATSRVGSRRYSEAVDGGLNSVAVPPSVSRSQSVKSERQQDEQRDSPHEAAQEQLVSPGVDQDQQPDAVTHDSTTSEPASAASDEQQELKEASGTTSDAGMQPATAGNAAGDVSTTLDAVPQQQQASVTPQEATTQGVVRLLGTSAPDAQQDGMGESQAGSGTGSPSFQVVNSSGEDQAGECWALLQQHCAWQKVMAEQLAAQVAALQASVQVASERSAGVEQRLLTSSAQWQQGFAVMQEVIPRVEQLAASTQSRVQYLMASTDQLVKTPDLDNLLASCATIKSIQCRLSELRDVSDSSVFTDGSPSSYSAPSGHGPQGHLHSAVSVNRLSEKRSQLPQTDLGNMPLPLPQLLPSFIQELNRMAGQAEPSQQPQVNAGAGTAGSPGEGTEKQAGNVKPGGKEVVITSPADPVPAGDQVPAGDHVGSTTPPPPHPGPPGWGPDTVPRHLAGAEHADTELSGIMHDLMHACFKNLMETKDGPLPGAAATDTSQGLAVREAALKRLKLKPFAVQQHVELLEGAKQELGRLVGNTAVSTVDYLCLYCLMLDIRLKLAEDTLEVHKEQAGAAFRNLETAFAYMKRLQEAINNKGSVQALAAVDRCLRSIGHEMLAMGLPPARGSQPGLLHGSPLGSPEFWAPFLSLTGVELCGSRFTSPPASARPKRTSDRPLTSKTPRLSSPSGQLPVRPAGLVVPAVVGTAFGTLSGTAFPPPSFHKDKRDILAEQQHVINVLKAAEQQLSASGPVVQYVGGVSGGTRGLPVLVRQRPSTAKPDLR